MATKPDGGAGGCTFQWKIENISHCWLKKGERICSPTFIADAVDGTSWLLWLYPMGDPDENYIGLYMCRPKNCNGPDVIKVRYQLAFLGKDGSVLMEKPFPTESFEKDTGWGHQKFCERKRVFVTEREAFLPEDTLTVQCTLFNTNKKSNKLNRIFATTVIKVKRRSFVWRIENINTIKSSLRNKFKDYLINFELLLGEGLDKLDIDMISFDDSIIYISCKTSIIDSEGKNEICAIKNYFVGDLIKGALSDQLLLPKMLMEKKSKYMPNDVLTLDIEFVFSTVEHFGYKRNSKLVKGVIGNEKSEKTAVLADHMESMYKDGIFSDTEIRTLTKTFPAHKNILSARSAVFRNMFSHNMRETTSGHVDITDFDEDAIHRMLLFIYTDSLEDLKFESASELYAIADKYEILTLKSRCSSYFIENLCAGNACNVLEMAVLHFDDDLNNSVQDYILRQSKQFFSAQEWKDFMKTHLKLAADIMHRKITRSLPSDV